MTTEQIGCGDNSCIFGVIRPKGGMGTNGGCRCFENLISWSEVEKRWNRAEVNAVRRDTQRLMQEVVQLREKLEREQDEAQAAIAGAEASLLAEREHSARLQREAEERHDELRAEIERLRSLTPSGTYSLDWNYEQERQRLVTERDEARACEAEAMRAREIMARMVAVYRSRLRVLTACRCDEPWTSRNLHAPECHADEGWLDEPTPEEMP